MSDRIPDNEVQAKLGELALQDRQGAVWCAVLCVRTVGIATAPAVQTGLRLLALWAQGVRISPERMRRCYHACSDASINPDPGPVSIPSKMRALVGDGPVTVLGGTPATELAQAVTSLLYGVEERFRRGVSDEQMTELGVTLAVRHVLAAAPDKNDHLALLCDLVNGQLTPQGGIRVGTLGQALARAWRWRLRWSVPDDRTIAETLPIGPEATA